MDETTNTAAPAAEPAPVPAVRAILARKLGMTRVFSERGEIVPVTVLEAGPCPVVQVKTPAREGYAAIQLGFGGVKARNVSPVTSGHFGKSQAAPTRWLREFRVASAEGFAPGMSIRVEQFAAGDRVDVSGVNKGKGFAGAVKRHRFRGGPKTHGQSDRWRAPGSSGRERVWPGKRGPGHMGAVGSTVQRLEVVSVDPAENVMLLRGSVPGPTGACVSVIRTTRPRRAVKAAPAAATKKAKAAPKAAAKK